MHNSTIRSFLALRPFFRPYRTDGTVGALCMLLGVGLLLPIPLLTMYLIDQVIPTGQFELVLTICGICLIVLLLTGLCSVGQRYFFERFDLGVATDIQLALVTKLQRLSPLFRHAQQTGYLMARVQDDPDRLQSLFANSIVAFSKDILILLVGTTVLFVLNWHLALAALALLPFFVFTISIFSKRIRRISEEFYERSAQYSKKLEESIGLLDTIIALEIQDYDRKKISTKLNELILTGIRQAKIQGWAGALTAFVGGLAPLVVIGYGIWEIFAGNLTLGGLIAFNSFVGYVFGPSSRLVGSILGMQQGTVAWQRIHSILNMEEPNCKNNEEINNEEIKIEKVNEFENINKKNIDLNEKIKIKNTNENDSDKKIENEKILQNEKYSTDYSKKNLNQADGLEIENVTVEYDGRLALQHINLHIVDGQTIALVGESGSGKSTLLRTIAGLTEYSAGSVKANGKTVNFGARHKSFAILDQEPVLFHDTIANNIRLAAPQANLQQIIEATQQAQIHDFIKSLPKGYNTMVDDRGINLSVGQKQRIALARCILRKPKLLLLDEPTSNLDTRSEEQLLHDLRPFINSRTTIIAAHRLHTISTMEHIVVLKNGQIVEQGNHQQLIDLHGEYHTLWALQSTFKQQEVTT